MSTKVHGAIVPDLKAADGTERVLQGYGSVFWTVDAHGDRVLPGAFDKSIKQRRPLLLWQHNSGDVIGAWDMYREDAKGLYLEGRLATTPRGQEAYSLLKMGALQGLSIGFRTIASTPNKSGGRDITEAELWEVSVVSFAANPDAAVHSVRSQHAEILSIGHLGTLRYLVDESLPSAVRDGEGLTGWQMGKVVEVSDYLLQRANRGDLSAEHLEHIDTMFQLVKDARAAKVRCDWVEAMTPKPKAVIEPERSMAWRMAMTERQHALQQPHGRW